MNSIRDLFGLIGSLKAGVIGDLMLDTYLWGTVERISPEAPVPVVAVSNREYRIGGAGNVALNARSMGSAVSVFSVLGADRDGERLLALLKQQGIDTNGVIVSKQRVTTSKTRVISRNQQMLRLDEEHTQDLDTDDERLLLQKITDFITEEKPDLVIFEDYNKGVLTERIIRFVIDLCRKQGVLTAVDPKRRHFFSYQQADIFKPNLKEIKEALNILSIPATLPALQKVHEELQHLLQHHISLITLSEHGVFVQEGTQAQLYPTHIRSIADVSGAGDTVIAVAALVYAATKDMHLMAQVANIAGGLVCEEVGTVAVNRDRLQQECELLLSAKQ